MRAPTHPRTPAPTTTPVVLVASFNDRNSAAQTASDYFAEWEQAELSREQRDIGRMMRSNRADFLS